MNEGEYRRWRRGAAGERTGGTSQLDAEVDLGAQVVIAIVPRGLGVELTEEEYGWFVEDKGGVEFMPLAIGAAADKV